MRHHISGRTPATVQQLQLALPTFEATCLLISRAICTSTGSRGACCRHRWAIQRRVIVCSTDGCSHEASAERRKERCSCQGQLSICFGRHVELIVAATCCARRQKERVTLCGWAHDTVTFPAFLICDGQSLRLSLQQSLLAGTTVDHLSLHALAQAKNEVKVLAALDHPNCVQYSECFESMVSGGLSIVMEFCDSGDLDGLLKK